MQPVTSPIPQLEFEDAALDKHLGLISMDRPKIVFDFGPANRLLGGIYPCQMTAFGASPGAGKTTLMGQLADGVAASGNPVLFITEELPVHKLVCKSLVRLSGGALTLGDIPENVAADTTSLAAFEAAVGCYRATIAPNISYASVSSVADIGRLVGECIHACGKTPVVFIDYLQLLATKSAAPFADERLAINDCVTQLRAVCNTYGTSLYVASSVSREFYGSKPPSLKMFGGASTVEYSFDNALYLHEDKERCDAFNRKALKLTAIKARYRALDSAPLTFDGAHAVFREVV